MRSRADRPYGRFPRVGPEAPVEPATPRPPRRWFQLDPSPRAAALRRAALAASLALLILALIGAGRAPARVAQVAPAPTPTPTIAEIYRQVSPTVVEIHASGADPTDRRVGSGVIVDDSGTILTALHVVSGTQIVVRFADGTESPAGILNAVPDIDIAVLRARSVPLGADYAVLGDPGRLRVGDDAIVIGSPFGLTRSLTTGVVSGLGRNVEIPPVEKVLHGLIQFDAAVNPGNSGGPLFDRSGEVVGIVVGVAKPPDASTSVGIGFAVTIDTAGGALGLPPD